MGADGAARAASMDIEGYIATLPEPTYGHQLQDFAIVGLAAEGTLKIRYTETEITLADGTVVSCAPLAMRTPIWATAPGTPSPCFPATVERDTLTDGPALDDQRIDALVAFLQALTKARYEGLLTP